MQPATGRASRSPRYGKRPFARRQTALPPNARFVLPLGVALAYDARLALGRLWQLYRRIIQTPSLPDGYRWRSAPMPQAVRDLAADCGLILGPKAGRVVVECPCCHAHAYVLRAAFYGWACRRCYGQRWSQLDVSLATYAMGLRIGYRGRPMVLRRRRIMLALHRRAMALRTYDDLVLLAFGPQLLEFSPHWPRRRRDGRRSGPLSPFMRRIGPIYIQATIDNLLHPAAFFGRYGPHLQPRASNH